jgi:ABC-type transport system substrate-binding protein
MSVAVASVFLDGQSVAIARYVAGVLSRLGYRARFTPSKPRDSYFSGANPAQLGMGMFFMDYPRPSSFFEDLRCGADSPGRYCNPTADKLFTRALTSQRTDPANAHSMWAALDRVLTDDAARLTLYEERATIALSDRVGNYLLNPKYGPLFGQMWVR